MELPSPKITTAAVRQGITVSPWRVKFVAESLVLPKKPENGDFFQAEVSDRAVDLAGGLLEYRFSLQKFPKGLFA